MNLLLLLLPISVFCIPTFDGSETSQKFAEDATILEIPIVQIDKPSNAAVDLFEQNVRVGAAEDLFQGDIELTKEQKKQMEMEKGRTKRQAHTFANRWTNNTVYFYFDDEFPGPRRDTVYMAQKHIQSHTCLDFVESRTAPNRIRVYDGFKCSSGLGMVGGEQHLSLGYPCDLVGVAAHEFAHSLGFVHMQSRSDRDDYLTVYDDNIDAKFFAQFRKMKPTDNILYAPFEYGSFMQYPVVAWAKEGFAMIPKDKRYLFTMGNRQISFYDMKMVNDFYGCGEKCLNQASAECKNGGYPSPRNCSKCNCPAGYGGDLCDQRPSGCGETFTATSEWQAGIIEVGDRKSSQSGRNYFDTCTHWIAAPEGRKIEVQITKMLNVPCDYGCGVNGIEIKTETNTQIRNPLVCCDEFTNKTFTSALNPTPIVSFNRQFYSRFEILFRYMDEAPVTSTPMPKTVSTVKVETTISTSTEAASTTYIPTTTKPPCMDTLGDSCSTYVEHMGGCKKIEEFERKFCARTCGYCKKRTCPKHQYMKDGKCVKDDRYDVHLT